MTFETHQLNSSLSQLNLIPSATLIMTPTTNVQKNNNTNNNNNHHHNGNDNNSNQSTLGWFGDYVSKFFR
jgi:hypothetical protein